jgi:rubrerythrin
MDPTDDPQTPTRRAILGTTATLAALGLAGCSGDTGGGGGDGMITEEPTATPSPTPMPTEEPTMAPTETETERPTETESMAAPDVPILNYALTLEHLENAFYREGLETFTETELMESESLSAFGERVRMEVPEYLRTVGAHEAAHVSAIADTVEEAEYDFGYETPSEFLGVAKALENTGVAAYKGAAPSVSNDAVFAAALGIHSVEARHAALLNELNTDSPFPSAVDEPMSMDEVVEIDDGFIVESGS